MAASELTGQGVLEHRAQAVRAYRMFVELDRHLADRYALQPDPDESPVCVALVFTSWLEADDAHPFFGPLVRAIRDRAIALSCDLIYCLPERDRWLGEETLERCVERGASGLIVFGVADGLPDVMRRRTDIAAVFVDSETIGGRSGYIHVDNLRAFEEVVMHLATIGRQRIATITGVLEQRPAAERLAGYRSMLQRFGYATPSEYVRIGDNTHTDAYKQMLGLLTLEEPPDAVATATDAQAVGAIRAITEVGLRCPEDVAVTGFDDAPWSPRLRPPLTTVRQPAGEIGATALEEVVAMIRDEDHPPPQLQFDGALVVRSSCGARLSTSGAAAHAR